MKVRLKLKPGQRGTIHLLKQYGDRLVWGWEKRILIEEKQ